MANPYKREVKFPAPLVPSIGWTPPEHDFGHPRKQIIVAYTSADAYAGKLWRCDVCMAAIVEFPPDHPFTDIDGLDPFQRHAEWHRALVSLEQRK